METLASRLTFLIDMEWAQINLFKNSVAPRFCLQNTYKQYKSELFLLVIELRLIYLEWTGVKKR